MNNLETIKLFLRKHLVFFAIAALAVIAAFLYINRYLLRLGAAQPPVAISFNPPTNTYPINQAQTATLIMQTDNPANKIEGFDITLKASGTLNFLNASKPTAIGSTDETLYELEFFRLISPQTIRLSYSTLKASSQMPSGVQITVTYQGTGTGSGAITVDQSLGTNGQPISKVTGNVTGQTYDLGTPGSGNYTFSGPTPSLTFVPSTGSFTVGQQFDVAVMLDTAGHDVDHTDVVVNYNTTQLNALTVVPGTAFPNYYGSGGGLDYIDEANGIIQIGGAINTPPVTPINGSNLQFATITFQALTPVASSTVSFDFTPGTPSQNDSNIAEFLTGVDILAKADPAQFILIAGPTPTTPPVTGTPPPTPIPTATPIPPTSTPVPTATPIPPTSTPVPTAPPATITLNLTIRLEGRTWVGANHSRLVTVCVKNTAICASPATTNNLGQATNIALTGLTVGTHTVLIKPEGFLQRAVTLNLVSGSNVLDMTGTQFLAGDLSNDNFVNAVDYVPLLNGYFLTNTVVQVPGVGGVDGDFDGSGQINGLDFSLMLKNWNIAGEQ